MFRTLILIGILSFHKSVKLKGSTVKSIVFYSGCGSSGSSWAYYFLCIPIDFVGRIQKSTGSASSAYFINSNNGTNAKFILDIKSWIYNGSEPTGFTFDFQAGYGSQSWGSWVYNQTYTIKNPQDATQISEQNYSSGSKMSFTELGKMIEL